MSEDARKPPPFDPRPTVRLDHSMPENPKVVGLSDAAFRLYVEAICWCSRQEANGRIPAAAMTRLGKPRTVVELVKAGLLTDEVGSYEVHDYLAFQRSSEEIAAFRASKKASGAKGAHMRWHIPRRQSVQDCDYCQGVADA